MHAASLMAGLWMTAGALAANTTSGDGAVVIWTPPTTNADGSPLTDLIGFNVYHGTSPSAMMLATSVNATTNSFAESSLQPAVWYWFVTTVNAYGTESAPSAIVSKNIAAMVSSPAPATPAPGVATPGVATPGATTPGTAGSSSAAGNPGAGEPETQGERHHLHMRSTVQRDSLCKPKGNVWCFRIS